MNAAKMNYMWTLNQCDVKIPLIYPSFKVFVEPDNRPIVQHIQLLKNIKSVLLK